MPEKDLRHLPAAGGADRAIRVSTAAVVLSVAGIAAYISYLHAYAVVREWGESGVTALLEPATIDGLVYASSMVILYSARHRVPVPRLARWMLALGILASLAVNVAQGWSHGLAGAIVAAWPAVSLVGSYELLAWMVRIAAAAGPDRVPEADHSESLPVQSGAPADQDGPQESPPGTTLSLVPAAPDGDAPAELPGDGPGAGHEHNDGRPGPVAGMLEVGTARPDGPARTDADHEDHVPGGPDQTPGGPDQLGREPAGPDRADHGPADHGPDRPDHDVNAAAAAAYRASVQAGSPLSERKLAGMFGKTSRRWARGRMAEAEKIPA